MRSHTRCGRYLATVRVSARMPAARSVASCTGWLHHWRMQSRASGRGSAGSRRSAWQTARSSRLTSYALSLPRCTRPTRRAVTARRSSSCSSCGSARTRRRHYSPGRAAPRRPRRAALRGSRRRGASSCPTAGTPLCSAARRHSAFAAACGRSSALPLPVAASTPPSTERPPARRQWPRRCWRCAAAPQAALGRAGTRRGATAAILSDVQTPTTTAHRLRELLWRVWTWLQARAMGAVLRPLCAPPSPKSTHAGANWPRRWLRSCAPCATPSWLLAPRWATWRQSRLATRHPRC